MVRYLFLALFVLAWSAACTSPEPVATCTPTLSKLNAIPISLHETQSFPVDDLFAGFNLEYDLTEDAPDFVHLSEKTTKVKNFPLKQTGLKSYHLEHVGNQWGKTLITLSEDNLTTVIRWGASTANDTIPELTESLSVEASEDVWCFDAIWVRHAHIAIIDCVQKVQFGLQNIFKFVNTTAQVNLPNLENDMFIGFTTITRRRMFTYSKHGSEYLVRSYLGAHVDSYHEHNTYLQIMTFDDPLKPRTIKVIDRTFLGQDKLSISQIQHYNGRVFVLDYHSGMTVLDVSPSQNVSINYRYRTDSGYIKMSVFRGNLDHQLIGVFSNTHAIYQIDFTNQLQPRILAKYNLMQDSLINSLWVNQHYVIAQVTANVTNSQQQLQIYNASIVFSRGTRTYLNAYDMIAHKSDRVIIDFQRHHSYMLIIDEQEMDLYHLGKAVLTINPISDTTLNQTYKFDVKGLSVNQFNGHSSSCLFTLKYTVTDRDAMTIWETGLSIPNEYYANFPGELFIPLNRYILASNITWNVQQLDKNSNLPSNWILQQNDTLISWQRLPSLYKITFLRQQQYDSLKQTDLYLYMQDASNLTHFVKCSTVPYTSAVKCQDDGSVPHAYFKIWNLTASRFIFDTLHYVHVAAVLYEPFPNQVFIYNAETKQILTKPIILPLSYQGKITSIEMLGHYLVVVLRYIKEIVFFDIRQCINSQDKKCKQMYRVDSILMRRLGVDYFSPIDVKVSKFHRFVLFIQSFDRVIILTITPDGPELLAQIESPGSKQPGYFHWKMAISHDHVILVNPPNTIEQHSIRDMYFDHSAPMTRSYPTYNYMIPTKFDLDFSDAGRMIYITAEDTKLPNETNSVILVYRVGLPQVASFYDVYHLYGSYEDILLQATGNFGDYVSVTMNSILHMYRQYQIPIVVFSDGTDDFQFKLTYTNDPQQQFKYFTRSAVIVDSYPQKITINDSRLNSKNFLNDRIDYQQQKLEVSFNDSQWWKGSVVDYGIQGCKDCSKFKVVNHLQDQRHIIGEMNMDDFVLTYSGGLVQQAQTIIKIRHNDSIEQFVTLPSILDGENCLHIAFDWRYDFSISACIHKGQEVNLYWTTYTSFKPHVSGPFFSSASSVARIDLQGDLLMLVDVDEDPSVMSREGGIFLYHFNHDINEAEIFDELEFIDTTDLLAAQGWKYGDRIYIGNAHLVYTNISDLYRLSITQLLNGVFFVDFRWKKNMRSIQIVNIEFMDLREQLHKNHLPLPNLAFFQSLTVLTEYYNAAFKYWQIDMIITTRNFHIFQINCFFDSAGKLVDHRIVRVYYRYGFYQTTNYIKSFDGYFAVVQKLPIDFQIFDYYSKQVLTVYDTKDKFHLPSDEQSFAGDISASYMLGGMTLPQGRVTFDFKFSIEMGKVDPFYKIGLIVLHSRQAVLKQMRINKNVSVVIEAGLASDENINLVARNDYSSVKIPINLIGDQTDQEKLPVWAIVLIIVGCLIIGALAAYIIFIKFIKKKKPEEPENKESLLEQTAHEHDQNEEDDEYDEDQDEDEEEDEDESDQEQGREVKSGLPPPAHIQPVIETSINRESVASADTQGQQKLEQPKIEPVAEVSEEAQDPKS